MIAVEMFYIIVESYKQSVSNDFKLQLLVFLQYFSDIILSSQCRKVNLIW